MVSKAIQPDFFGGIKIVKGKGRPRNSSFHARCFAQLKVLADLYTEAESTIDNFNDDECYRQELDLELKKVQMLVREKNEILRKNRDAYKKRGK